MTTKHLPLALLGGPPAFAEPLHVGRPNIGDRHRFQSLVNDIFDRRWLTNDGPHVREFERRIGEIAGVAHCVATCNATVALEIAVRALDMHGEVIVPSYTFVATAHALQRQGITPVFTDIDPLTHNLNPALIERMITPRTTGIIGVHVWGRPCDDAAIQDVASRHGLAVMYDAAHAFACSRGGRMTGGSGSCEVFSFHATKFLNSFEGGAIVTNNDALAAKARLMRNFGFAGYDSVVYLGTNGKMTEVCAAMGLVSLDSMAAFVSRNRENINTYTTELNRLQGLRVIGYDPDERHNYQYVVVEVDPSVASLSRDEIVAVLHADNVLARKYFWPGCHNMEPYRSLQPHARLLLPETERVAERVIVLPTGQSVSEADVLRVCNLISSALSCSDSVRRVLGSGA